MEDGYQELLGKEKRQKNIRITRYSIGLVIMVIFVFWLVFFGPTDMYRYAMLAVAIAYIVYALYRVLKGLNNLFSLTDELHYEDGELVKYNPKLRKAKKWIPLEKVEEVYFDIKDKPNLLFVVYRGKDGKKADSFYKQRIKDEEEFMEVLKEKSLISDESIKFEDLKKRVESG